MSSLTMTASNAAVNFASRADPVAETPQFTVHAPMPPQRILTAEPDELATDQRPTRRSRLRPLPCDQPMMPGQQRTRRDHPLRTKPARQYSSEDRKHRTVRPRRLRNADLATQYRDLMPQHQDLRILRRLRPSQQHQPPEHPRSQQIDHPNKHNGRSSRTNLERSTPGQAQ
jgi:hypothetical protein